MPPPTRQRVRRREEAPRHHPVAPRRPVRRPAREPVRRMPGSNQVAQQRGARVPPVRAPGTSNIDASRRATRPAALVQPRAPAPAVSTAPTPAAPVAATGPAGTTAPVAASAGTAAAGTAFGAASRTGRRGPRFGAQARAIEADHGLKQQQAQRLVASRVQLVATTLGGLRAGAVAVVGQAEAGFRRQVAAGQARLGGAVNAIVTALQAVIALGVSTLLARLSDALSFVTDLVSAAVSLARIGVLAATNRVAELIGSISLPDVPGVAAIRARAVEFLAGATGFVSDRLDDTVALVQGLATGAAQQVEELVRGAVGTASNVWATITSVLRSVADHVVVLLTGLAAQVAAALRRALSGAVLPLLNRVQAFVTARLRGVLAHALRLLRLNRDQQLGALDRLATLRPRPRGTDAGAPDDPGTVADADRVVADAVTNSNRVLRLLVQVTGASLRPVLGFLAAIGARVRMIVLDALARIGTAVGRALDEVVLGVQRLIALVGAVMRSVLDAVERAVVRIVDELRQAVQRPLDAIVVYAVAAVTRIQEAVLRLVRTLADGATAVVTAIRSLLGDAPTTSYVGPRSGGPITKPPPGGIVIPIISGFLTLLFVIGSIVVAKFGLVAVVGAIAVFLGVPVFVVVIVVGVLVLIALALLLVLVIVLIKTLLRGPKKPPTKRVVSVAPTGLEIGVGGRDLTTTARIAPGSPGSPPLVWTVNPGGTAPAGIVAIGTTRRARLRAGQPPVGTVTGGLSITVRAALAADPTDFADSAAILVVQVTEAHYDAVPPLFRTPPQSDPFPPNSVDPNRDGVGGSRATVVTTTAPAGRAVRVTLLTSLGATVAGITVTPGARTGDIRLRIFDGPTGARLDQTRPSLVNPPILMSTLVVDSVPTKVSALRFLGRLPAGPYSALNDIVFATSDTLHPLPSRLVGELITLVRDDFSLPPPNGAFNPGFVPALAAPVRFWRDQLVTPTGLLHTGDGRIAIDVNRFVGPGVPALPRAWIFRQQMVWVAWRAGNLVSTPVADGQHLRTLVRSGTGFGFTTHHTFAGVASRPPAEAYVGPALITLSGLVVTPTAAGATALAADGASTAIAVVTTSVPGLPVAWTAPRGGITIPSGNPSVPPGAATVQAGVAVGRFGLHAADTVHPNRSVDGRVAVAKVRLRRMSVAVAGGSRTVSVTADPGGRTVLWTLDAGAVAAGVTVSPTSTGPGPALSSVTVTPPTGFRGKVVVTAQDSVVAAAKATTSTRFR